MVIEDPAVRTACAAAQAEAQIMNQRVVHDKHLHLSVTSYIGRRSMGAAPPKKSSLRRFHGRFELFPETPCQAPRRPLIFAPSQHNAALQGSTDKGCGVDREVGAAKLARWLQQKKIAELVDETRKALHNLVSLLQTTQRAERQSRVAKFFNNQTTDKCGRWVADATVFGQ
ncbi:hypothetical protein [Cupriavidus oxalaticus]|uniref:hypothetical protein n=1 Tax=Cupriavidus oxalaticus TaxID=96344 RepID=UPI003F73BDDF